VTEERVRLEIGFDGGQIMGALVTIESADALDHALSAGGDSAIVLDAEDGRYTIPVTRVVYVKRYARESRVGFGAGPG
jgi:hypothetical protein